MDRFRTLALATGLPLSTTTTFPIQTLAYANPQAAIHVARHLRHNGIWPVCQIHTPDHPKGGVLRFVLTASHTPEQIDCLVLSVVKSTSN